MTLRARRPPAMGIVGALVLAASVVVAVFARPVVSTFEITPEDVGLKRVKSDALRGGSDNDRDPCSAERLAMSFSKRTSLAVRAQ